MNIAMLTLCTSLVCGTTLTDLQTTSPNFHSDDPGIQLAIKAGSCRLKNKTQCARAKKCKWRNRANLCVGKDH